MHITTSNQAILSTALLYVYDSQGEHHTIRALIDCGSQSSFITEELCNVLRTSRSSVRISISGISGNSSAINHKCNLKLFSTTSDYSFNLDAFILGRITGNLPEVFFSKRELNIPVNIKLADPTLNIPIHSAQKLSIKILSIFKTRCFELVKWRSNSPEVLKFISSRHSPDAVLELSLGQEINCKTLGLCWSSTGDTLTYKTSTETMTRHITKRFILSRISSIFDPLGLLSPSIILVKMLLQRIWSQNLKWDESLPQNICLSWISFANELHYLNALSISRKVVCDEPIGLELHCFCDASESAYGSCVYIRPWNKTGYCSVELLCAKSKVAPLKTLTVPRLEFCAALVLSRLATKFLNSVSMPFGKVYCWSDSTIVLNWLQTPPHMLKQFLKSRNSLLTSNGDTFRQVTTPADLVTRGLSPEDLIQNDFIERVEVPEQRRVLHIQLSTIDISFERFSNLLRLQRSFAYVLRFISNCRNSKTPTTSYLSVEELSNSLSSAIKISQIQSFYEYYSNLLNCRKLGAKSKVLSLNPFLDEKGVLRAGGRLSKPSDVFSDNSSNFVGAANDLRKFLTKNSSSLIDSAAHIGIRWCSIPVNSPNFGGLWEAGVKSVKAHLKRVTGETSFTYEDLSTLIIQIEGVLNSRPMSPVSPDPNDFTPLTPAHFLLGRSMQDIPEANFAPLPANRLSSYEFICKSK
nr:unnamed protein product [Callosobruchus analis]